MGADKMTNKTITVITPILCAFLCVSLGIIIYVPGETIRPALEMIINTVAVAAVILAIGGLLFLAWIGYTRGAMFQADLQIKRADANRAVVQSQLTIAAQGAVIVTHQITGDQVSNHLFYGNDNRIVDAPAQFAQLAPPNELPTMVTLSSLLPRMRGDMNRLIIGVEMVNGVLQPVTISLYELFHTIVAASSGWGKSAFGRNILTQLATGPDEVEFVLIDQQQHGLAPFRSCDRLRYPILSSEPEILAALKEVHSEAVGKRAELFAKYDAENLQEYNQQADDPLPPIVVAVDEAAALLNVHKDIGGALRQHAWELRKFGVYQILMLTSAKGTVIDTPHRQQFASKVQLHANDKNQARLLLSGADALHFPPGRAVIELPGKPLTTVQTPLIGAREIRSLFARGSTPAGPMVVDVETDSQKVIRLFEQGKKRTPISIEVFGGDGGNQLKKVDEIINSYRKTVSLR